MAITQMVCTKNSRRDDTIVFIYLFMEYVFATGTTNDFALPQRAAADKQSNIRHDRSYYQVGNHSDRKKI